MGLPSFPGFARQCKILHGPTEIWKLSLNCSLFRQCGRKLFMAVQCFAAGAQRAASIGEGFYLARRAAVARLGPMELGLCSGVVGVVVYVVGSGAGGGSCGVDFHCQVFFGVS